MSHHRVHGADFFSICEGGIIRLVLLKQRSEVRMIIRAISISWTACLRPSASVSISNWCSSLCVSGWCAVTAPHVMWWAIKGKIHSHSLSLPGRSRRLILPCCVKPSPLRHSICGCTWQVTPSHSAASRIWVTAYSSLLTWFVNVFGVAVKIVCRCIGCVWGSNTKCIQHIARFIMVYGQDEC